MKKIFIQLTALFCLLTPMAFALDAPSYTILMGYGDFDVDLGRLNPASSPPVKNWFNISSFNEIREGDTVRVFVRATNDKISHNITLSDSYANIPLEDNDTNNICYKQDVGVNHRYCQFTYHSENEYFMLLSSTNTSIYGEVDDGLKISVTKLE
ncbi:hypothetical protein [Microbulbifer sp. 2205BS26-8]|uniref:hypothetical protein n=1 Tax=Microbulbifer sp. 2205BS26-8 TaxID=3064386 RepID=UPI00273FC599|nr:hypothetical protein [Microbulbifer sp. 2205BS26-8]MDP5210812.1 hypothetical protein [Microbulbifer sp. 2205BS26-8]